MAEYVEKWGDSIDSAVELALRDLKITREEAVITVLEQPSSGFLGLFGRKLAKVRVEKKAGEQNKSDLRKTAEQSSDKKTAVSADRDVSQEQDKSVSERDTAAETADGNSASERGSKKSGRARRDPAARSENRSGFSSAAEHISGQEEKSAVPDTEPAKESREGGRKKHRSSQMHTKFTITAEDTDAVPADIAQLAVIVVDNMDIKIEVKGYLKDDTLYVSLEGKDVGSMIGKRGQTLDAVQYLASIVQNKNCESHVRVIINAEKYREKREKTLQLLAKRLADKCIKSGRSVRLEPMNPYERKVIHSALQSNPKVTTRSEGVEPNRRVVIELKR